MKLRGDLWFPPLSVCLQDHTLTPVQSTISMTTLDSWVLSHPNPKVLHLLVSFRNGCMLTTSRLHHFTLLILNFNLMRMPPPLLDYVFSPSKTCVRSSMQPGVNLPLHSLFLSLLAFHLTSSSSSSSSSVSQGSTAQRA